MHYYINSGLSGFMFAWSEMGCGVFDDYIRGGVRGGGVVVNESSPGNNKFKEFSDLLRNSIF